MAGWQDGDRRNEDLCKFEESNVQNKMGLHAHISAITPWRSPGSVSAWRAPVPLC